MAPQIFEHDEDTMKGILSPEHFEQAKAMGAFAPSPSPGPTPTGDTPPEAAGPQPAPPAAAPAVDASKTEAGHFDPKLGTFQPAPASEPIGPKEGTMADKVGASFDKGLAGVKQEGEAGVNAAREQAGYMREAIAQQGIDDITNQERESDRRDYIKDQQARLEDMHVDPNHMWKNMETGNKILAGISIALGGVGGALTGQGGNAALDVIDKAIARDIDAQKAGIAKQENLIHMARANFSDERQAEAAARVNAWNTVINKSNQIAQQYAGTAKEGQMKQAIAGMELKKAEAVNQFQVAAAQQSAKAQLYGGGISGQAAALLPPEQQKLLVPMPGGGLRAASDEAGKKMATEAAIQHKNLSATLDEMQQMAGAALPFTEQAHMGKALLAKFIIQNDKAEGAGRLSPQVIELIKEQLGDPTGFRQASFKAKLDLVRKQLDTNQNAVFEQTIPGYKAPPPVRFVKTGG